MSSEIRNSGETPVYPVIVAVWNPILANESEESTQTVPLSLRCVY